MYRYYGFVEDSVHTHNPSNNNNTNEVLLYDT